MLGDFLKTIVSLASLRNTELQLLTNSEGLLEVAICNLLFKDKLELQPFAAIGNTNDRRE
jgi:hypothetical protein